MDVRLGDATWAPPLPAAEAARILLHDFGGYAFTVQLARWLAARGHAVLHLHAADIAGPHGPAARLRADPPSLAFDTVRLGRPFARYALHRRLRDELAYGRRLGDAIGRFRPDVVLSANAPPLVQRLALRATRACGGGFVNWVQDVFSFGGGAMPSRWPGPLRSGILAGLRRVEFGAMTGADALVVISPDFQARLDAAGVLHPLTLVQENWSPPTLPAGRAGPADWVLSHGLGGRRLVLVAGTLGLKHNPDLVADLARGLRDLPDVRVVAASQGPGRDRLEAARAAEGLENLVLLDYQPADRVPDMLAAAEIGVVILNRSAGAMSMPSKLYTYASAGLPVLAAVPSDHLAHRMVRDRNLGLAVEPEDAAAFVAAGRLLLTDAGLRGACAASASAFARDHNDIDRIGPRFEEVMAAAMRCARFRAGRQAA